MSAGASILSLRVDGLAVRDGCYRAVVYLDGISRQVDREYGSWRVTPAEGVVNWSHVPPAIAAELQRLTRKHKRQNRPPAGDAESGEQTMSAASDTPKTTSKPAKAKPAKPKAAAKKAPAKKTATKKAVAKPSTRKAPASGGGPEKNAKALALREAGKSYPEIAVALGWANPGVAWNAVKRAKDAASK